MGHEIWLSVTDLAALCGVTRQAAHRAASIASDKGLWRGMQLQVREVQGSRGGRSGTRYEVALSSLSEAFQTAFMGTLDVPETPAGRIGPVAPNQGERIERKWRIIEDAVAQPYRSAERAAEIDRAHQKWGVPVRTIQRWITDFEKAGGDANALGRRKPADAGAQRVWVSRRFDDAYRAARLPEGQLAELGEAVALLIKRGWTSSAQRAGWKAVRREVLTAFKRELAARNVSLPDKALYLSQRRIMDAKHYRAVDIRSNDRKAYDDAKPRIRRNNALFDPMAQVVMDVKPLDNIVRRADGSTTWPKMIGFQDVGTHRVFRHFVLLAPGEGIRQEHVAEAFIAMVSHPEWGFPQQLYRDNGTEFYILDMVRNALALINEPGARTIVNAKPYAGSSKPIESKFAVLDRFVFSQMGGYAGGNRMNKKTQTVGKPTKPYDGSFEDFVREANERIEVFEHDEIGSGPFKGQSPQGSFAAHVARGWRPVGVHPLALDAAFSKRDKRRVDRGVISIAGVRYTHPELPNGQDVPIALPWRRDALPLVDIPDLGWAALNTEMMFLPGEIAGAIESSRIQQISDRKTRQLRHEAPPLDLAANHRYRVANLPGRAAPAPLIDLAMSDEAKRFAGARICSDQAQATELSDAERRRLAEERQTERLLRKQGYAV